MILPDRLRAAALVAALGLVTVGLSPAALAATADDPIEDGCGDVGPADPGAIDVDRAWVDPDAWELVVQLCADPDDPAFREQAKSAGYGWRFLWTDEAGTEIEVRAWVEDQFDPGIGTAYEQALCRGGSQVGSSMIDYPQADHEDHDGALVLGINRLARSMERMEEIEVRTGSYAFEQDLQPGCDSPWDGDADRAPDGSDVAGPLVLAEGEVQRTADVTLRAPEPQADALLGGEANWTLEVANDGSEHRNVTLSVDGPEGVVLEVENRTAHLERRSNVTRNVTATVPADAPVETLPVTVRADVSHRGETLGTVELDLDLTAVGFRPDLRAEETTRTLPLEGEATFPVELRNGGNRPGEYNLSLAGDAAAWASLDVDDLTLDAGERADVPVTVVLPNGTGTGGYDLTVRAEASLTHESDAVDLLVSVQEHVDAPGTLGAETLPAPGLLAVAAILAGIAVARRRRP